MQVRPSARRAHATDQRRGQEQGCVHAVLVRWVSGAKVNETAFITGISGQDGSFLAQLLLAKGYKVIGGLRRNASGSLWRLEELGIREHVEIVPWEMLDLPLMLRTLERVKPDEIYNLAAQSFVKTSFDEPLHTADVNAMGVLRLLEAVRTVCPTARVYQASSSELFGNSLFVQQEAARLFDSRMQEAASQLSEESAFEPRSPYAVSKLFSYWAVRNYREAFGLHASNGILFNHESPLRGLEFVTRKITDGVSRIACGEDYVLKLGNLEAKRDWGFAGDYVEAMWLMLQQDKADDYVVATGETHSVKDVLTEAVIAAGMSGLLEFDKGGMSLDGRRVVAIDPSLYRPTEVDVLLGDASKARRVLGWKPKTTFNELIAMMVEADLRHRDKAKVAA